MNSKKKVIAYFIRLKNNQKEVLVFDHDGMPEAGTQVVGGTLEEGEDNGLKFNFYWLSFDDAKQRLTGNFAECLHLL